LTELTACDGIASTQGLWVPMSNLVEELLLRDALIICRYSGGAMERDRRTSPIRMARLAVRSSLANFNKAEGVIGQSQKYEPRLLLETWQRFEKQEIGDDTNLTVQELAEKFLEGIAPGTNRRSHSRL
jgi:hypothetical protein